MAVQLQPRLSELSRWTDLAESAGFGFELIDLFSAPVLAEPELLERMVNAYRDTGLVRSVHGAFIDVNPASADPLQRKLSRLRCEQSCRLAKLLNAENIVFHCSAFPFLRGAYLDNWAAACADFYLELAEEYKLNIFVENAQDLDPAPLRVLMDRVSDARVSVCLDVGHLNYARVSMEAWFYALWDNIGCLHLSDNMGLFDDHIPLGEGTLDWDKLQQYISYLPPHIPVTLETGDLDASLASLRFLKARGFVGLEGFNG